MKKIAIIGCGWLGKSLAESLIAQGYHVRGSVTSEDSLGLLQNMGIEPFLIKLNNEAIIGNLNDFVDGVDTIVIAFPPGRMKNPDANYASRVKILVASLAEYPSCKLLLLSSTGVFGASQGIVNEESSPDPDGIRGQQLLKAEKSIQTSTNQASIVRLGGLIGDMRHPAKQLAGRTNLSAPKAPTNLVHKEDVVRFLMAVIEEEHWGKILHCVSPVHHQRAYFYTEACKLLNLPLPSFSKMVSNRNKKVIDSSSAVLFGFIYRFANCGVKRS